MRQLDALATAAAPERHRPSLTGARRSRSGRHRLVRLDDAVTWFLGSWSCEGPKVPTRDTIRTYSVQLKWFVGFAIVAGKPYAADALQPEVIRAALKAKMAPSQSPCFKGGEAAANSLAMATRKLARWLLAQGVPVADLSIIKPPRAPERIQPRLRIEEFQALEAAILHQLIDRNHPTPHKAVARDLALLYLLSDTGLRCGEVCSMTIDDVDFDRGTVSVWHGKGRKQRVLSILDAEDPTGGPTLRLMAEWLRARETVRHTEDHEMLWTSLKGRPLTRSQLRTVLTTLCTAAGLDGKRPPHAFRRANFTDHYRDDPRAIKLLAARMGWSEPSARMISIYTRGAELELAATEALPSLASRWHETPQKEVSYRESARYRNDSYGPILGTHKRRRPAEPGKGKSGTAPLATSRGELRP